MTKDNHHKSCQLINDFPQYDNLSNIFWPVYMYINPNRAGVLHLLCTSLIISIEGKACVYHSSIKFGLTHY